MSDKYGRYFAVIEVVSVSNKKGKKFVSGCKSGVGENVKMIRMAKKKCRKIVVARQ